MNDDLFHLPTEDSLPRSGRLIGIDFGTVRIGLAVCDSNQSLASPLQVYIRRNDRLDRQFFIELAASESAVGFVIGLPLHTSGQPSQKSRQAIAFGQWLLQQTGIPVTWFDERFTTSIARDILNQSHLSGKKKKAQLDKLAAQIVLSTYLDSRRADSR